MYAVVGCTDCSSLWVVEGRPETTQCPTCGKRRQYATLKKFHRSEDAAEAKQARAAMLADRQDQSEAFADLDHFATMDRKLEDAGVDDETYLSAQGLDPDDVAAAGERATEGTGGSRSRKTIVQDALRECAPATESAIVAAAEEQGVSAETTQDLLTKLVRAGEALQDGDTYRPV